MNKAKLSHAFLMLAIAAMFSWGMVDMAIASHTAPNDSGIEGFFGFVTFLNMVFAVVFAIISARRFYLLGRSLDY